MLLVVAFLKHLSLMRERRAQKEFVHLQARQQDFRKMAEIHGFAILEKSTNVKLRTIRKEDMEIFEGKKWTDK